MDVQPLWQVRAKRSTAKCLLHVEPGCAEVVITDDEESVAARELFQDVEHARTYARELHARLIRNGWRDAS